MVLIRTFTDADPVVAGAASGPLLFAAGWFFTDPLDVSGRDTFCSLCSAASSPDRTSNRWPEQKSAAGGDRRPAQPA